jgi:hypothetical protein
MVKTTAPLEVLLEEGHSLRPRQGSSGRFRSCQNCIYWHSDLAEVYSRWLMNQNRQILGTLESQIPVLAIQALFDTGEWALDEVGDVED